MNKRFSSRHGAVMTEPVIAVAFFAIISVFLLKMFASTEKMRSSAEDTSKAVIRAESVMESVLASERGDGLYKNLGFHNVNADGRTFLVKYYDKDWNECEEVGKYMITMVVTDEETGNGKIERYDVNVSKVNLFDKSGELFSLSTKKYISGGNAE